MEEPTTVKEEFNKLKATFMATESAHHRIMMQGN